MFYTLHDEYITSPSYIYGSNYQEEKNSYDDTDYSDDLRAD